MGLRGLLIGMIVVLTGCNCPVCPETGKDKVVEPIEMEANKEVVRKLHEEVWSKGNVALIPELYHPNLIYHLLSDSSLRNYSEITEEVLSHRKAFPDWREDLTQLIAEGDMVVSRFRTHGTHLGRFWDIDSTGIVLEMQEVVVFKLREGKIAEQWSYPDLYGIRGKLVNGEK
jgi:predicted ester cyclase